MKNTGKISKLWTVLPILIFTMTCGLFVYTFASGGFSSWKITSTKQEITSSDWNNLMDELDIRALPDGAIMAFTDSCPTGWTRYSDADGRFLMGASVSDIPDVGGRGSVTLEESNLPSHSHYIRYGWSTDNYGDNANKRPIVVNWSDNKYPWSNNGTKIAGNGSSNWENLFRTSPAGSSSPIDILNPYVKVLFCVKGDYTPQLYTVQINPNNSSYGWVSSSIVEASPGTSITKQGNNLYVGDVRVTATAASSNGGYSYSFSSWTTTNCGSSVTSDCIVYANFNRSTTSTCFAAGTKVMMENGTYQNIEDVKYGDMVMSYNVEKGITEGSMVTQTFVHENGNDEMYELTVNGNVLKVTANHPFYVGRSENTDYQCEMVYDWVNAEDLLVGDMLFMYNGQSKAIENINHYDNEEKVYNLEVSNNHTYFVDEGYLVHNKNDIMDPTDPADPWL